MVFPCGLDVCRYADSSLTSANIVHDYFLGEVLGCAYVPSITHWVRGGRGSLSLVAPSGSFRLPARVNDFDIVNLHSWRTADFYRLPVCVEGISQQRFLLEMCTIFTTILCGACSSFNGSSRFGVRS